MLVIITSTGDRLFIFINNDDLERPWASQKRVLQNISQFLDAVHISTLNCDEMAGDIPRQPAYEISSTKRRFQLSKSWPPRFKEAHAGRHQRRLPPYKVVILPQLSRVASKWLQIGTDMLLIITSTGDKLFIGVNVDDLEWPWTLKLGVLPNFLWFPAAAHILRVNCTEMAGDGPGQPAFDIFGIERTFLRI